MTLPVLRSDEGWWLRTSDGVVRIDTAATTTAELLADQDAVLRARDAAPAMQVPEAELPLRSPVTVPCRVLAQMTNFASHVVDAGMDPATVPLTFFRKSSGSISDPEADVVRPAHVTLLDYEVEIGLVIGRTMHVGEKVTEADMPGLVAALVVCNDVSARDVQLPKTQFYEAKSYPTFTPVGPVLLILEEGDFKRFDDLRLRLWVDGELRQEAHVGSDMIYEPLQALRTLSRFQSLDVGDLILTGTPVGTALSAPPKLIELIGQLLPPAKKWQLFFRRQAKNPRYLQDGQMIEATVATDDGELDLGRQRTKVRWTR